MMPPTQELVKSSWNQCRDWVKKLNHYYNRDVRLRSTAGRQPVSEPYANPALNRIFIPREAAFYDKRLIAHEYAHILTGECPQGQWHNGKFEAYFREACLVLGVFPIPLWALRKIVREAGK